jgi:hypothetical protein
VTVGSLKQEDHVPGCLGKKQDPISKITRERRAGGMVQVVEHLPMSSNLSATKQTNIQTKREKT